MTNYYGHTIEWVPELKGNKRALYLQIADSIEKDIQTGKLPTGSKLPPQRIIADYLKINHSTVTKAYKLCETKGIIEGIVGKGTYVKNTSGLPKTILTEGQRDVAELGMLHPLYETNHMLNEMVMELTPYLDRDLMYTYSNATGWGKHKHMASKWLANLNIEADPNRMVITSGAQNALYTVLMTEFQQSDKIAVDELTYTGLRNSAIQLGIKLIPVPSDREGMIPDLLEKAIQKHKVKGVYLIPDCHNPTTIIMTLQRRKTLAQIIKSHRLVAIEDSVFRFTSDVSLPTLHSLIPEHCYHIASVSKMINPGFRIAYLLIPERARFEQIEYHLHNLLFMPSSITAEIVSCLQSSKKLDDLLKVRRELLKSRNMVFDKVFKTRVVTDRVQSMFRFVELPADRIGGVDLEARFKEQGVKVYSADRFRIKDGVGIRGIRISVCSAESPDLLEKELTWVKRIVGEVLC